MKTGYVLKGNQVPDYKSLNSGSNPVQGTMSNS